MAIQEVERFIFGTGYLSQLVPGATSALPVGVVNEVSIDIKIDQKEIWGEGGWAVAAFDGQRTLDISAKHYKMALAGLALDLNGTSSASAKSVAFQEAGAVAATSPYTATLANGATYIAGTLQLYVFVIGANAKPYPVLYNIVAAGSEVAGKACSISGSGVLTFAAGDAGLAFQATYQYGLTTGGSVLVAQTYQNSAPFYQMALMKRDRSPIDGSLGVLLLELYAVRPSGWTLPFKENDASNYDRKFMAFADPTGNVAKFTFVNQ